MTISEAQEIIKNAQPIVFPKSGNTVSIKEKKITIPKKLFNGNGRRKKGEGSNQEGWKT